MIVMKKMKNASQGVVSLKCPRPDI